MLVRLFLLSICFASQTRSGSRERSLNLVLGSDVRTGRLLIISRTRRAFPFGT
jgi:hypothetical protein